MTALPSPGAVTDAMAGVRLDRLAPSLPSTSMSTKASSRTLAASSTTVSVSCVTVTVSASLHDCQVEPRRGANRYA